MKKRTAWRAAHVAWDSDTIKECKMPRWIEDWSTASNGEEPFKTAGFFEKNTCFFKISANFTRYEHHNFLSFLSQGLLETYDFSHENHDFFMKPQKNTRNVVPKYAVILHTIVMNYDRMSKVEMQEQVYSYAGSIQEEELLARQIVLCLLRFMNCYNM